MRVVRRAAAAVAAGGLIFAAGPAARAQVITWNLPAGGSWNTAANWNPATVPNGNTFSAVFNNGATASNPAQTGNRSVTLDGPQTVASITFNNDVANAFTQTVATGTGGPLTLAAASGPATINIPAGPGTGNNTISVATVFGSDVVAQVDNVNTSSATGALNFTATITGTGGFTKRGDG